MPLFSYCSYSFIVVVFALAVMAEDLDISGSSREIPLDDIDEATLDLYKRLYNFGLGKRAYSYLSEYKRLPVYNFGLGKRAPAMYGFGLGKRSPPAQLYSFGLGKRVKPSHMYSFGLGKRSYEEEYPEEDNNEEEYDSDTEEDKRNNRLYSFGLGKRARAFNFGLGKRDPQRLYSFGLGKKAGMYDFGLGKRGMRDYAFGLGKRPVPRLGGSSRFNFGLGKRDPSFGEDDEVDQDEEYWHDDNDKRFEHRYAFGLGKREVAPQDVAALKQELDHENEQHEPRDLGAKTSATANENSTGEGKDQQKMSHSETPDKSSISNPYHIVKREEEASNYWVDDAEDIDKRNPKYKFIGLGKKTLGYEIQRPGRRMYNFGLGKRIPMYNFGVGKRSDLVADH